MICKTDLSSRKVTGILLKFWKPYGAAGPTPMYPVLPWEIPHVKSTAMLGIWNLKLFILHWRLVESFYCVSINRQDIKTHLAKDQRSRYLDAKDFLVIPKRILKNWSGNWENKLKICAYDRMESFHEPYKTLEHLRLSI